MPIEDKPYVTYLNPNDWNEKAIESKIFTSLTYYEDASVLTIKGARSISRGLASMIWNEFTTVQRDAERQHKLLPTVNASPSERKERS